MMFSLLQFHTYCEWLKFIAYFTGTTSVFATYRVIRNSLTHFIKSAHLSGGKNCNVRPVNGKRNSPSLSFVYLVSAVCVRPAWHGRCPAADNPFPSILAAVYQALLRWPPSSPNLMPRGFFLWRYVKDSVFLPPLTHDLPELRRRIIAAIWEIDLYVLQQVWAEMDYRLDVRHVTKGGLAEHF